MFVTYFHKIPKELEESAEMDGCGFFRTFLQVMLPLSKPIVATTAIMQFMHSWNSFFLPLVFTLDKPNLRTLGVGMFTFVGEYATDFAGMAAAAVISILPVMIVFLCFQRYFVEGINMTISRSPMKLSEICCSS